MSLKIRDDNWYIVDATQVTRPKVINARFLNKKAATLYWERRLSCSSKHLVIKGSKFKKLKLEIKALKRRFYSKYAIPNSKILSFQGRKTFRTTMRRKLFGYMRVAEYSHHCDGCKRSEKDKPKLAKKRDYLFNGRIRRLCDKCHIRYTTKHGIQS